MKTSELTVVVRKSLGEKEIQGIGTAIGIKVDRHYVYEPNVDVVFYVPEEDIERVGKILGTLQHVIAYNFNDVRDEWI